VDGAVYALAETGGFQAGDSVFVTGVLNGSCTPTCGAVPCIESNTIAECVSGCGYVLQGNVCLLVALDDGGLYRLDDPTGALIGDRVCVSGALDAGCKTGCGAPCLRANTLVKAFADCGILDGITQGCVLFQSGSGDLLPIENTDGFVPPAEVYVSGRPVEQSFFCFPFIVPGVVDNVIGPCFAECGTLVQGVECVLFETDGGDRYLVSNRGLFEVGDRVRVEGILDPSCATVCQETDGCVNSNVIASPIAADLTCDGEVNVDDLVEMLLHWGPCPPGSKTICTGDINGDGVVDINDLVGLLLGWSL
jgi:hypothetical protein